METLAQNWADHSPQKNTPTTKFYDSIVLYPQHSSATGVLQVELLLQLAERRLIADALLKQSLQSKLPFPKKQPRTASEKADQITDMIHTLRSLHLELSWRHDNHELYFKQQLLKNAGQYPRETLLTITDESIFARPI